MSKYKLFLVLLMGIFFALPVKAFSPKVLGTVIDNTPDITITAPATHVNWNLGSTYDIVWTSTNVTGNVSILIGNDFGAHSVIGYVAKNISNSGKYTWTINENLVPYDNFLGTADLTGVTSKLIAGEYSILIINDAKDGIGYTDSFNIIRPNVAAPTATLTANNATTKSVTVDKTATLTLNWTSTNAQYCEGYSYYTGIKTSDGAEWSTLKNLPTSGSRVISTSSASSMSPWVYCYNSYGDSAGDYVYIFFKSTTTPPPAPTPAPAPTPVPPSSNMKALAPVAGEKIKFGSTYAIKWSGGKADSKITLSLYGYNEKSKTNFQSTIVSNLPNNGSYVWDTNLELTPSSLSSDYSAFRKVVPGTYYILIIEQGNPDVFSSGDTGFFTVYTADTAVRLPIGNFDKIENGKMSGWALDPDLPNVSVQIQYFFDGPAGSGKLGLTSSAGVLREDVNKVTGYFASYGFDIAVPDAYKDGQRHSVYAYAMDLSDTSKSFLLPGSPKTFTFIGKPADWHDGSLFLDQGAIFVIAEGKKWGFASMSAFKGLGYDLRKVRAANTSDIPVGGFVSTASTRHLRGSIVLINGAIYFIGKDFRYPYPSAEVFLSWNQKFEDVIPGNDFDKAIPEGPIVQMYVSDSTSAQRDSRRLADIRMLMTALELHYNDCNGYPLNFNGLTNGKFVYLTKIPANPTPGGSEYVYAHSGDLGGGDCSGVYSSYSLIFSLESPSGGFSAGNHTASPAGIQ